MPRGRGLRGGRGPQPGGGNDSDDDGDQQRRAYSLRFKGKLTGKSSYDWWDAQLQSFAFGKGPDYHRLYTIGKKDDEADDPAANSDLSDPDFATPARREMGLHLFQSY